MNVLSKSLDVILVPCPCMHIYIIGLTTTASTNNSDMTTAPSPPVTTSSEGLSQKRVITIIISSVLGAGGLIFLIVLVVRKNGQKNKEIADKTKKKHFANNQGNLTKKDDLKSFKPRKSKLSEKRNTKLGNISLDKKKEAQLGKFACKDRMYQHYPQTTDCWNNCGNQHVFNNSHNEENMMFYGNQHDNYLRPDSRLNNRMLYQSCYPEYPGHNEGMFQYYKADNLYRGQQMYQRPYVALYDKHIIDDKQDDKRGFKGRPYEKNWDLLY